MRDKLQTLHERLTGTVLGAERSSFLLITSLLAGGHVLIQGPPGIGKTSLAQALARSIDATFSRIQFTPDLLPADITGYSIYNQQTGQFQFIPGPVFSSIVLADEINRTSPRIQSAMFECMNDQQVTVDGVTRKLESPFMVIATQNNLYSTGTFPLPEPQLDRFLLSIHMALPDAETQAQILELHAKHGAAPLPGAPVLHSDEVRAAQQAVSQIAVNDRICRYITAICEAVRKVEAGRTTLSARASIALMRAAQAAAWLDDAKAVHPDHIKAVAAPVLNHRIVQRESRHAQSTDPNAIVDNVLRTVPVP